MQPPSLSATPPDAAPALSRLDAQRGLHLSIWEGIWATVFNVLTGGAFLTGFALLLHASPFVMGLVAGLPAVVGLLQVPASLWARRAAAVGARSWRRTRFWGAACFCRFCSSRSSFRPHFD